MDILITEDIEAPALASLAEKYSVVRDGALWNHADRLRAAMAEARTILIRNQTQVTADLLDHAPRLIGIGRFGVGLDNIDLRAASARGIVVISPLGTNATSVAELTLGLMLALARKIPQADRSTKTGQWDRKGCTGIELDGKTLAVCGFGRIGRLVATRARAFGMRILVFDPFLPADEPALREMSAARCEHLTEALAAADFVTAHLPLTPETRRMFNADTLAKMKSGAYFINTARGGVVDEPALLEELRRGRMAGAALEVRAAEPPDAGSGFETLDNVILTPHIGAFTLEAQRRTFDAVMADLERLLRGEPAVHFVNFARPQR